MSDPQDRIAQSWNEAVERHIAGLSDNDFNALVARTRSQSMSAKAQMLWNLTEQCRDGQGYTAGMSDAAAARGPAWQPPPEPTQQPGFGANRGQTHSGSGTDPTPPKPPIHLH